MRSRERAEHTAADDDRTLALAAQHGDRHAFAVLTLRHRPLLIALCRRMLGDAPVVEDAVQEAILQALLGLDGLRRPERFGPWLGGIGLNVCRRMLRERSRDAWTWEALIGGRRRHEATDADSDPAEAVVSADMAEHVRRAVATLPRGQRAAVLLFYLGGLTHAETAAQLGVEVGAVKTRLHKARTALRRRLTAVTKEETAMAGTGDQIAKKASRVSRRRLLATSAAAGTLAVAGITSAREERTSGGKAAAVSVRVADVRSRPGEGDRPELHLVLLEQIDGPLRLPIWIGQFEAVALATQLQGAAMARPLTYRFAASLLKASGGMLREVQISRLVDDTFYALAIVEGPDGITEVDARPSDALNLALAAGAPISVDATVLDIASQQPAATKVAAWYGDGTFGAAELVARHLPRVVPPGGGPA
jgi:RNA polymerase sigma factor (sigma-70 family)